MRAPNLYTHFGLDSTDNSTSLGVLLSARDARLSQEGYSTSSDARRETNTAYGILGNDEARALYDEALRSGRPVSWAQLQHLSDFGTWPQDYTGWTEPDRGTDAQRTAGPVGADSYGQPRSYEGQPMPQPGQPGPQHNPYGEYASMRDPAQNPYGSALNFAHTPGVGPSNIVPSPARPVWGQPTGVVDYAAIQSRASNGTRWAMGLLDSFFATIVGGAVFVPFDFLGDVGDALGMLIFTIVFAAYFIVPEVKWGGSPAKLAAGYEVRDATTFEHLTLSQSLRRNWFRLANILPGLGSLVGFIGGLISISTVSLDNNLLGSHDRMAGAEVVKRLPRGKGPAGRA